jgi:hypothetical protein
MFLSVMGVAAFLVVANQALAVEPLKLTWTSLAPKTGAVDKLFEGLTEQQLNDLARLYQARRMANNGDKSMLEDLKPLSRKFLKQGVDVESLFARLEQVTREADRAVVPALSGKRVALSGYLLPLEYSEKKTTEFLLVPYVGACIHAPTPPANQIVHVKFSKGYKVADLFTPVTVTGTMWARSTSSSLNYIDGTRMVGSAYALDAVEVDHFKRSN